MADVKVELEWIGEGRNGYYDPNDPLDEKLLRFTVYRYDIPVDSYCTLLPLNSSNFVKLKAVEFIKKKYQTAFDYEEWISVRQLGKDLSWISPDWFEDDLAKV